MPGLTSHYPPEFFEREVVQLYRSSGKKSIPKIADELGVATKSLRRWIKNTRSTRANGKVSSPRSARS